MHNATNQWAGMERAAIPNTPANPAPLHWFVMASTKAELIKSLDEHQKTIKALEEKLRTSEAETRRFQNDASRDGKNWRDCEEKLSAIRQVVTAELKVRHGVNVTPQTEWFNGRDVSTEETNEEIRLLRHIHELSNTQPPF